MFSKAEGYVLEEPVRLPPTTGQTGSPDQNAPLGRLDAPRGVTPLWALFLLKLLRMKWRIGERL
jgi:hypothetical protein